MYLNKFTKIILTLLFLYTLHPLPFTQSLAYAASKGNPPVAYWRFDEGGGPTAYDSSGNGNHGTLNGGSWVKGKFGKALRFDGTVNGVSSALSPTFSSNGSWSITYWVMPKALGVQNNHMRIDNSSTYRLVPYMTSGNEFHMWTNDNDLGSGIIASVDTWYHIAATYNGTTMIIYVNGVARNSANVSLAAATLNRMYYIGSDTGGNKTNAIIDDVRIYNYARTPDQIMVDYNAGMASLIGAGTDTNEGNPPVCYLPFNENTGTTAYDRSGNGYNGALSTSAPTWTQGKYGSALDFNGTNNYVELSANPIRTNTWTLEMWFNIRNSDQYDMLYSGVDNVDIQLFFHQTTKYLTTSVENNEQTTSFKISDHYNEWHYVTWTHSASNQTIVYIDGQVVLNATDTTYANNGETIDIGKVAGSLSYLIDGKIDDVKIYDYARTPGQVAYDYNKGKPVAQYRFDEGIGTIAHNDYSSADSGSGCVGWWRMDNNWNDSSGNSNNGTANGGATFSASSKIGPYCGSFNGTDGYASCGNGSTVNVTDAVTIEAWVNPGVVNSTRRSIVEKTSAYFLKLENNNKFVGGRWGGPETHYSLTTPTAGNWYHVAMTYDKNQHKIYVNGVLENSENDTGAIPISGNSFNIAGPTSAGSYWNGLIDDVRIYNYARTAEQVYNDYKTTHGTMVGSNIKFVDGKIGRALQFNGTDDYLDTGNNSNLSFGSGDFTLEAWIKTSASGNKFVIDKSNSGSPYTGCVLEMINNHARFQVNDSTAFSNVEGTKVVNDNSWHHIVGVRTGSTGKVYVDGILDNTGAVRSGSVDNSVHMNIGRWSGYGGYYFPGIIDDVRVYNYSRGSDQVMQDYNEAKAVRLGAQSAGTADPWGGAMPVAYYKFDENTGVLTQDSSGNKFDLQLVNGAGWGQGKNGPALYFNGTSTYLETTLTGVTLDDYTVEFWLKQTAANTESNIVVLRLAGTSFYPTCAGQYRVVDNALAITTPANGYTGTSDYNSFMNNWVHMIYTRDNTDTVRIYKNGVFQASAPGSNSTAPNPVLRVGNIFTGRDLIGYVDDLKIYNYCRASAQIAWDYNKGKPVGYWRFDEASGTTAYDDSGNGNTGTITIGAGGTQTTIAGARTNGAAGKFGKCMSFDGTDDYAEVPHSLSIDPQQAWTLSAWVKRSVAGVQHSILEKYDWASGKGNYTMRINSNDKLSASIVNGTSGQDVGTGTVSINAGAWYHVAATYDSSTHTLTTYVNGAQDAQNTNVTYNPMPSTVTLKIGARGNDSGTKFNGLMDDVRIYNYARTSDQILQDYTQGLAAKLTD